MPRFRVRFLKTVANDTGHESKICQREMEIEANDMEQAMARARERFCVLEGVSDWTLHAEAIEIEPDRERQWSSQQSGLEQSEARQGLSPRAGARVSRCGARAPRSV